MATTVSIPLFARQELSMGTDPEIFVFSGKKVIPAFRFLPSKEESDAVFNAYQIKPDYTKMPPRQVYWDGWQAESKSAGGFGCLVVLQEHLQTDLLHLLTQARKVKEDARLSIKNVIKITPTTMAKTPKEFKALGCKPSLNAYGLAGQIPGMADDLLMRMAGGHIHIGAATIGGFTEKQVLKAVKMLDAVLGVWAVTAAQSFDVPIRRRYYGLVGEYRTPMYGNGLQGSVKHRGIEYRTLSNFWLAHPMLYMCVFEMARMIVEWSLTDTPFPWAATDDEVIRAIQTCDVQLAQSILARNEPLFHAMWQSSRFLRVSANDIKRISTNAFRIGMDGIEKHFTNPDDIDDNWDLSNKVALDQTHRSWNFYKFSRPTITKSDTTLVKAG